MNKILEKRQLSANVWRMKLEAPLIARERKAGYSRRSARQR